MSREYVSTEFNCRRISVIFHRSASEKLAVYSLVLLTSPKRERKNVKLANCFQPKIVNDKQVSGKLSKCLYIHSYMHLITSSALNECLLAHNF